MPTTPGETSCAELDALYHEIVTFVLNARYPSCSLIQRRFKINFSAVKTIIEKMDKDGIKHGISKPELPNLIPIKIVLIGNPNSENLRNLIERKIPGVEFIILDVV